MRKTLLIALRDYNASVRTKSFVISLVFLPVMMLGSFAVQALLKDRVDTKPKHFAVIDRTDGEAIFPALLAAAETRNTTQIRDASGRQTKPAFVLEGVPPSATDAEAVAEQRLELSDRVRRGELAGVVEIGRDVDEGAPHEQATPDRDDQESKADERQGVRFQTHSHTLRDFTTWLSQAVAGEVQKRRCKQKDLSPQAIAEVVRPVPVLARELSSRDPVTGAIRDGEANRMASVLLPVGLVMMMFMMIFVGATPLLQGVIEEKMQRIAEVLLGSVRPFPLMMGKLLGTLGVATTLSAVYLGGAYLAARHYGLAEHLSPTIVAWFAVYQVLGVLLFGSLFIAVGASCTNAQESQTLLMPVMLLAMLPLFVMTHVVTEPNSPLAVGASLIPTATPTLMLARIATAPGLPLWQPLLGVALVLLTTVACVWAAGRVFRVGLLMQGKGASFREMARWVVRG